MKKLRVESVVASLKRYPFDPVLHAVNRHRLAKWMRERERGGASGRAHILLRGGEARERHETDHEELFRQESTFAWLFGVKEPDCYGLIEIETGAATLFIPRLKPEYAVWMGRIRTTEDFRREYGVSSDNAHPFVENEKKRHYGVNAVNSTFSLSEDEEEEREAVRRSGDLKVRFVDELLAHLEAAKVSTLYTLKGTNTDSGRASVPATYPGLSSAVERVEESERCYAAVANLRCVKTVREIALMRHVCSISSEAHRYVMSQAKVGMAEFQLESLFQHYGYFTGGCRHTSYTSICGCGENSSVLHYGHAGAPNDGDVKEGDLCLLDMGCELYCYGSDITCTFPAGGKFTPSQRVIYETVLEMQREAMKAMRPGVSYLDLQALVYRIMLKRLRDDLEILRGEIEEMMNCELGAVFMPHGLGHLLGIDTHDVGGKIDDEGRSMEVSARPGFSKVRLLRPLKRGMVVTVEPGVYFNNYLIDGALADERRSKFIVREEIAKFRGAGGVRLEDDVLITRTGIENLTDCPRDVRDVERLMMRRGE